MNNRINGELQKQIESIPHKPGVYKYLNRKNEIIYIGKAKDLRKRVSSYFINYNNHNIKTKFLVKQIQKIDYIIVNSEKEAFLLENNLIKEFQPKYNINLKDGKSYPWVCITKEEFPRILVTRNYKNSIGEYFGPYTSKQKIDKTLRMIRAIYPYRTCKLALNKKDIEINKFKECLYYRIGKCNGPCINKISFNAYNNQIDKIREILKGNIFVIIKELKNQQENEIIALNFEQAENIEKQINNLKQYESRTSIINPQIGNFDVITVANNNNKSAINYMKIRRGFIVLSVNHKVDNPLQEENKEVFSNTSSKLKELYSSNCERVLTNIDIGENNTKYKYIEVPQIGVKRRIINLSEMNAKKELFNQKENLKEDNNYIITKMQEEIGLPKLPYKIECIDNSNTQGNDPVSACVVFINGKAAKGLYRIYKIRNVIGPDDYKTMNEVITRRYSNMTEESLPDLLILDGGKGQLNQGIKTLERIGLKNKIPIISLAERNEFVFLPNKKKPVILKKNSSTLKLIIQLRDEAHRFGVKHHTIQRDKNSKKSELEFIKGIGKKSIQTLLGEFKTVDNIKKLSKEELIKVIGSKKGEIIYNHFNNNKTK